METKSADSLLESQLPAEVEACERVDLECFRTSHLLLVALGAALGPHESEAELSEAERRLAEPAPEGARSTGGRIGCWLTRKSELQ